MNIPILSLNFYPSSVRKGLTRYIFKAVQDVKALFGKQKLKVYPIVFLRDDIFEQILDPDKSKWNDLAINLTWNSTGIKNLLAFRLSRAFDQEAPIMEFDAAWDRILHTRYISDKSLNRSAIEFISQFTFYRPRDYIQFLKTCADMALKERRDKISARMIQEATATFSHHIRSEMIDEIHPIVPEIADVFKIFSEITHPQFPAYKCIREYEKLIESKRIEHRDSQSLLDLLFRFNIIGNVAKTNRLIFRYTHQDCSFNANLPISVHPSLHRSLGLLT